MIKVEQGSSLYYSLLWTDPDSRDRFIRRLNLVHALSTTLDDVQEQEVAQKKIHWWHEELERMCQGESRHPSTKACQTEAINVTRSHPAPSENPFLSTCLSLLSNVSTARLQPAETIAERDLLLTQSFQARLALLSHALSDVIKDLDTDTHPEQSAEALAKHEQLTRLPALIHRGHPVFSDETYRAHKVTPKDLAAGIRVAAEPDNETSDKDSALSRIPVIEEKPGKQTLLTSAIEDTHATLIKATVSVNVSKRYRNDPLLPLWRLLILRRKQLALWQKKQPDLLTEHMALTPIAKLFYAWCNRR